MTRPFILISNMHLCTGVPVLTVVAARVRFVWKKHFILAHLMQLLRQASTVDTSTPQLKNKYTFQISHLAFSFSHETPNLLHISYILRLSTNVSGLSWCFDPICNSIVIWLFCTSMFVCIGRGWRQLMAFIHVGRHDPGYFCFSSHRIFPASILFCNVLFVFGGRLQIT